MINLTEDSQMDQSPAPLRGAGPSVYQVAAIQHSPMQTAGGYRNR